MTPEEYIKSLRNRFGEGTYMEKAIKKQLSENKNIKIDKYNGATYIINKDIDPIKFADAIKSHLNTRYI